MIMVKLAKMINGMVAIMVVLLLVIELSSRHLLILWSKGCLVGLMYLLAWFFRW